MGKRRRGRGRRGQKSDDGWAGPARGLLGATWFEGADRAGVSELVLASLVAQVQADRAESLCRTRRSDPALRWGRPGVPTVLKTRRSCSFCCPDWIVVDTVGRARTVERSTPCPTNPTRRRERPNRFLQAELSRASRLASSSGTEAFYCSLIGSGNAVWRGGTASRIPSNPATKPTNPS